VERAERNKLLGDENNSPSKNRRCKGEGNGSVYWRTINRNGKDYPQAYFHWKEGNKKRTKYIRSNLLDRVLEAEAQKRPIIEILQLLGVAAKSNRDKLLGDKNNNPSKSEALAHISTAPTEATESYSTVASPSKKRPSKTKRDKGLGCGSIQWKTITRNGKDYPQPWYHYEFWSKGNRLIKSSKYIPKKLFDRVRELDALKVPVREILQLLGVSE
jgi:hypothetical protein